MKWTERWMARAQRKADLRDRRYRRHEEGLRAGTARPNLLDRMQSWIGFAGDHFNAAARLKVAYEHERRLAGGPPLRPGPHDGSLILDNEWQTWIGDGVVVRGPDGVTVTIWIESTAGGQAYLVCAGRTRATPAATAGFCSFVTWTSARWYAAELARTVRQFGRTGLRPSDILPELPGPRVLAKEIFSESREAAHELRRLPQRTVVRWRQIRADRR